MWQHAWEGCPRAGGRRVQGDRDPLPSLPIVLAMGSTVAAAGAGLRQRLRVLLPREHWPKAAKPSSEPCTFSVHEPGVSERWDACCSQTR